MFQMQDMFTPSPQVTGGGDGGNWGRSWINPQPTIDYPIDPNKSKAAYDEYLKQKQAQASGGQPNQIPQLVTSPITAEPLYPVQPGQSWGQPNPGMQRPRLDLLSPSPQWNETAQPVGLGPNRWEQSLQNQLASYDNMMQQKTTQTSSRPQVQTPPSYGYSPPTNRINNSIWNRFRNRFGYR